MFWRLLLALLLIQNTTAFASGSIGTVSDNKGTACEIQRGKTKSSGVKGSAIEAMDVYLTQACSSNILFKDDTKVKITENSKLVIDDFVFDPKKSDAGKLAMKVTMGTVRYASGQIAKNSPQQVAVKTPTANIAVRGTDFSMTVDETGQSLVVLLPSCKEENEQKKYELEENRCKVGQISVSNAAGTVVLDKAFEATYITSFDSRPTMPTVINTLESKINNNLILVRPLEIERAIRDNTGRTKKEEMDAEIEAEAARRLAQRVKDSADEIEKARILALAIAAGNSGCNASTSVCVAWAIPDGADIQSRGKGIAFRSNEDHYSEVKTQGYSSNTFVTIVHNDTSASELIGPGGGAGNNIYIKQNNGTLRR
jgi:hypothetical protein